MKQAIYSKNKIRIKESGYKTKAAGLESIGLLEAKEVLWNLTPAELEEEAVKNGEGMLTGTGALMCDTGRFTGCSPKDRFNVKDEKTSVSVWWGDIKLSFDPEKFDRLHHKMTDFLKTVNCIFATHTPQRILTIA